MLIEMPWRSNWCCRSCSSAASPLPTVRSSKESGEASDGAERSSLGTVPVFPCSPAAPALTESIRQTLLRLSSGVGLGTLVLFTGQLAAMLGGGLHLVRILTSLAGETTNQKFRKVLMSVRDAVTGGTSFADALGQFPFVFDKLYVSVVRAGELSGSLPGVLDTLTVSGLNGALFVGNGNSNGRGLGLIQGNGNNNRFRISGVGGVFDFGIGGTLHVNANQTPGIYRGTVTVTVTYN